MKFDLFLYISKLEIRLGKYLLLINSLPHIRLHDFKFQEIPVQIFQL